MDECGINVARTDGLSTGRSNSDVEEAQAERATVKVKSQYRHHDASHPMTRKEIQMNRLASVSVSSVPMMRSAPNTVFPYKDTAMEAAHMEIERLHSANLLQQLLLDEATSRIRDLTKYQDNAAIIIARLNAKSMC